MCHRFCKRGTFLLGLLIVLVTLRGTQAQAQSSAKGSAFGESVDLRLLPLVGNGINVQSGPLPSVSGSAPPPFNSSNSAASARASVSQTGQILSTGAMAVNAASSVPNSNSVSASATVNNLDIDVVELLRLLTIDADTVQSTAAISGPCGQLVVATGTTTLTNPSVGGSLGVGITAPSSPAPNTLLLNAGGIRVVLNEQIRSGDGVNSLSLTVNAIHVSLNDVPVSGIGAVTGDIIISQSHVELTCAAGAAAADAGITMTASPNPVTAGSDLTFRIGVTNSGPQAATNVTVTDNMPPNATFVSAGATQGSCTGTSTISCNLGTINPGGQATVTIVVRPQAAGSLTNTATVSATEPDPNAGNNSATITVTVIQPVNADVSLSMSASPSPATVGEPLTFTLVVGNGGPSTATGVTVTDTLPASTSLTSVSLTQGSCTTSGGTVTCSLGTLANGAEVRVTLTVSPNVPGTITNRASVTLNEPDPNPADNTAALNVLVNERSAGPSKISLFPVFGEGQGLSSTLILINPCPNATASGIVELFDREGRPLSVRFNGTFQNGSFTFDIPPLGVVFFRTAGEGDLTVGSIRLLSNIPIDGSIIFAGPFGVAGVRSVEASTRFIIPIESDLAQDVRTGVAISNPSSSPVVVTLTLRDSRGVVVPNGTITITLPPHGQTSKLVDEFFANRGINFSNFKGSLEVSASSPVGGMAIHLSPGEFATLPITLVNVECK